MLFTFYTAVHAQGSTTALPQGYTNVYTKAAFGNWFKPSNCLNIEARAAIVGTNKKEKTYSWLIQFHNQYNNIINFTYYVFSPGQYNEFHNGQRISEYFEGGIMTTQTDMGLIGPQKYSDQDTKLVVLPNNINQVYIVILNVYFGPSGSSSEDRAYASDNCGKPTGYCQWNEEHKLVFKDNANDTPSPTSNISTAVQAPATDNTQNTGNDDIQNTLAVNEAKINAMKTGNTNTSQQQQVQQQQQYQNVDATAQAAGQILGSLLTRINNGNNNDYEAYKRKEEAKKDEKERKEIDHAISKKTATPNAIVSQAVSCDIKSNYIAANHYYGIAASMGNIEGLCGLATNLHFGRGVAKDDDAASKLLWQAYYLAQKRIHTNPIDSKNDKTWYPDTTSAAVSALQQLATTWSFVNNYSMEFTCRVLMDSLFSNKYKELQTLNSSVFDWFISSETRLIWFYSKNEYNSQTKRESLKMALNLCDKTRETMDMYLANASSFELSSYKTYDYNRNVRDIQELKNTVTQQLQAGNP